MGLMKKTAKKKKAAKIKEEEIKRLKEKEKFDGMTTTAEDIYSTNGNKDDDTSIKSFAKNLRKDLREAICNA